jgi:Domain of unknown function (DUF1963)
VSDDEVDELADDVVAGDGQRAVVACAADPELAGAVSRTVATRLVERAASHRSAVDTALFVWPGAQGAIVALAALPGADTPALAGALLRCCVYEAVSGEPDKLGAPALRLILDHCGEVVEHLFRLRPDQLSSDVLTPPWPNGGWGTMRFLVDALWALPGAEGARWMDLLLGFDPHGIVSQRARDWTPADWTLRLDALSDRNELPQQAYRLALAMLDPADPAPREAAPALARYACSRFAAGQSPRRYVGRAANVLAPHRTGDPEQDAALFWWGAAGDDELTALRWLLELSGPAGARPPLVEVARARGLVEAEVARTLAAELDRPLWADRDVPWVVTEVREEGVREPPEDVAALLGAAPWPTRTVVAVHPIHGRADAAVEVLADADADADADAEPLRWDAADDGLWVGRREDGRATRVIRDLGVLRLDLANEPPPWFIHDRVPPGDGDAPPPPAAIDGPYLRELAESGASLRRQRRALRAALHQRGVGEYASAVVLRHVRDGVALVAAAAPVRSRLGGPGRLPVGTPWPVLSEGSGWCLPLLAELALAELPDLEPLPSDGTLLIFQETETWSGEHGPLHGTRVYYVPESGELHDPPPPGDLLFPLGQKALRGVAVPVPGESELVVNALEFVDDRERTIEAMNELTESWWAEHWLLGASNDVQGPSRLEVSHVLESASTETRARFAPEELAGQGWTLLAQINEDADADLFIGDGGSFYLYILEQDLRRRRFDRVVGVTQSH